MNVTDYCIQHRERTGHPAYSADLRKKYHVVTVGSHGNRDWPGVHAWCREQFKDYTWCGGDFFFNNEEDAFLFALHWA